MIQIKPIKLGLPSKEGINLLVRTLPFDLHPTIITLYYEVTSINDLVLANGNLILDESDIQLWGTDDTIIEDIVLKKLNLERL